MGFGAAAGPCAPRDRLIGWSPAQRQNNLHLVVNNARFLILPWAPSKNVASKIPGLIARQLPGDWQNRYGYRPLLLETFVEQGRFTGVCYQAANRVHWGKTQGRGKIGPAGKQSVPITDFGERGRSWVVGLHGVEMVTQSVMVGVVLGFPAG